MSRHRSDEAPSKLPAYLIVAGVVLALIGLALLVVFTRHNSTPKAVASTTSSASTVLTTAEPSPTSPAPSLTFNSAPPTITAAPTPTTKTSARPTVVTAAAPLYVCSAPIQAFVRSVFPGKTGICYTVEPGDYLIRIAAQHGGGIALWQPIYGWNQSQIGSDPNLIHPGQVLVVQVL